MFQQIYAKRSGGFCTRVYFDWNLNHGIDVRKAVADEAVEVSDAVMKALEAHEKVCASRLLPTGGSHPFCSVNMESSKQGYPVEVFQQASAQLRLSQFIVSVGSDNYRVTTIDELLEIDELN